MMENKHLLFLLYYQKLINSIKYFTIKVNLLHNKT